MSVRRFVLILPRNGLLHWLWNILERPDRGEKYPQEGKESSNDTDHNCFSEAKDLGEHSASNGASWNCAPDYPSHAGVHSTLNVLWDNRLPQTHLVNVVDDNSNRRDKPSDHQNYHVIIQSTPADPTNPIR